MAVKDIPAGTLLLIEAPVADIPDEPMERDPAERCVLHLASGDVPLDVAKAALEDLKHLHPRERADIDESRYAKLQTDVQPLKELLRSYCPLAKDLGLVDNPDNDDYPLIRLVCALHFNGFVTGAYVHLAMINHSCVPNSVKWGARDGAVHSEVRATRFIRAGEEITISYLVPSVRSRVARQRALSGQFQFTCSCDLCEGKCDASFEAGPPSAAEQLESELEELEQHELEAHPRLALERATRAKEAALQAGLHARHLAVARANLISAEAALMVLDESEGGVAPADVDAQLVLLLLQVSLSLRRTQAMLFREGIPYADDRAAVAKGVDTRSEAEPTLHHIASGIGFFLAKGAKGEDVLRRLALDDDASRTYFRDARDASACHQACEWVTQRIADLYM